MSVLVNGMEMPINCDSCRIMVFEDTNCDPELFCGCPLVFKAHPQGEDHRPDYCPLVPVPPHGRLIDADALEQDVQKRLLMCNKNDNQFQKPYEAMRVIALAPTIIPAEEGNE